MISHGYKGAFEMSATLDYLFAYDATTNQVNSWCYESILDEWLRNDIVLDFISNHNPWALRDIAERLLEASNRNMWKFSKEKDIQFLKEIIYTTDSLIEKN